MILFLLIPLFIILVGAGLYSAFTCRPLIILVAIAGLWCWWSMRDAGTAAGDVEKAHAAMLTHARQWAKEDGQLNRFGDPR